MDPKDSKNVTFIEIYLRPSFSTKSSGLPDFYSVKLDVIGYGQKHIFGILRVHTLLLCIWFPSESGVLALDLVESWCAL